ncbi:MAG TPA: alkaline phosphatase family protein [Candidatus Sulfotelmatobacter sp.]|nr:alkaline phosphatase family protein [Candidatus Sulfotelmatobacter sp.]
MAKKVIVIGLDGLEPSIVETMLERGELPNLSLIRQSGSFTRLQTTYPAQTPVAWASFATGTNPGGHGIFDFIRRDPQTYQPDAALSDFQRPKNILAPPRVVNQRKGIPLWEVLTHRDIPSVVLRCPCTFPPDALKGRMLAGVGVPDLRGSQNKGTFYTQNSSLCAQENEQVVQLPAGRDVRTYIIGPRNTRQSPHADTHCDIRVQVEPQSHKVTIETGGSPAKIEIAEGSWSEWVRFKFKLSLLQSVSGIARFYVRQLEPHLELYLSAVNFDPAAPLFPLSSPGDYAKDLSEKIGLFSTLGMAEEHNALNNGRLDERAYLQHCNLVLAERERLARYELDRFHEGFFFMLYDTPDRVQHMMWRFRDPGHPGFNPDLGRDYGTLIEEHYQRCDSLLGSVIERTDENTLLIVLSDHGFGTFRRSFDTNTWLWRNGLLKLRDGRKPGEESGEGFAEVDWSKTSAYAVGLGGIYLNMKGREGTGTLEEGTQADAVRRAIRQGLADFPDSATGRPAVRNVARREDVYSGPFAHNAPDLLVNFYPGFRVSWQSAVGGFSRELIEDNTRRWSGDHIVAPESVPGILFMNRAARHNHARIIDLAPTILNYLGATAPATMEGRSLL